MLSTAAGEYVILEAQFPGHTPEAIGILLRDPEADDVHLRLRRDFESIADDDLDLELLNELGDDLRRKSSEMRGAAFFAWMEANLSNVLRISERERVMVDSFDTAVDRLYRKHVSPKILPFRTHLPRYTLRAAAGKFGAGMEVEPEGWVEAPPDLRLTEKMFVAHVVGRSMEPRIPDGSACVFSGDVTGSRNLKLVLVVNYAADADNQFTVKRYRSIKARSESGDEETWRHEKIILEPLNSEYESWELTPHSRINIIGEFVRVLGPDDSAEPTEPPR